MPTYNRVHLKSCLARAVRCAVENLRDDPETSHLTFHRAMSGFEYEGKTLYATAYSYLEDRLVDCTCGAIPTYDMRSGRPPGWCDRHKCPKPCAECEHESVVSGNETGATGSTDTPEPTCVNCGYDEDTHTAAGYCTRGGEKGQRFSATPSTDIYIGESYPVRLADTVDLILRAPANTGDGTSEQEGATGSTEHPLNCAYCQAGEGSEHNYQPTEVDPDRERIVALAMDLTTTLADPTQAWDIAVADFTAAVNEITDDEKEN